MFAVRRFPAANLSRSVQKCARFSGAAKKEVAPEPVLPDSHFVDNMGGSPFTYFFMYMGVGISTAVYYGGCRPSEKAMEFHQCAH